MQPAEVAGSSNAADRPHRRLQRPLVAFAPRQGPPPSGRMYLKGGTGVKERHEKLSLLSEVIDDYPFFTMEGQAEVLDSIETGGRVVYAHDAIQKLLNELDGKVTLEQQKRLSASVTFISENMPARSGKDVSATAETRNGNYIRNHLHPADDRLHLWPPLD